MAPKKQTKKKAVKPGTSKEAAQARKAAFVEAYIANGVNQKQAAITAGFSPRTAAQQSVRLLKDVNVRVEIEARQAELAKKYELTTDSVIAELSKIVHADPRRIFNEDGSLKEPKDWPDDLAGAIASVDVTQVGGESVVTTKKIKLWDKNAAIEKAMKHLGLFLADNKQRSLLDGVPRETLKAFVERLKSGRSGD